MYHPKNGEKKQVSFILTGMDFGLNPNQANNISKKKKPLFKESAI